MRESGAGDCDKERIERVAVEHVISHAGTAAPPTLKLRRAGSNHGIGNPLWVLEMGRWVPCAQPTLLLSLNCGRYAMPYALCDFLHNCHGHLATRKT